MYVCMYDSSYVYTYIYIHTHVYTQHGGEKCLTVNLFELSSVRDTVCTFCMYVDGTQKQVSKKQNCAVQVR